METNATPLAPAGITALLERWNGGDRQAHDEVATLLYDELRRLAHRRLRGERSNHTLNTTGLVHEAYVRLAGLDRMAWTDRNHFMSMASRAMRRVLVDHARKRNAAKRGERLAVTLDEQRLLVADEQADTVLELDEALQRLGEADPRAAQVVEFYYFAGFSQKDVGEVLGISQPTVARDLRFAHAWLQREWGRT